MKSQENVCCTFPLSCTLPWTDCNLGLRLKNTSKGVLWRISANDVRKHPTWRESLGIYFFSSSFFSVEVSPFAITSLAEIEFGLWNCLPKGTRIIQNLHCQIIMIILWALNLSHRMVKNHSAPESFLSRRAYVKEKRVWIKGQQRKEDKSLLWTIFYL